MSVIALVVVLVMLGAAGLVVGGSLAVPAVAVLLLAGIIAALSLLVTDPVATLSRLKAKQTSLLAGPNAAPVSAAPTSDAAAQDRPVSNPVTTAPAPAPANRAQRRAAARRAGHSKARR
jgi:hypothetical protein